MRVSLLSFGVPLRTFQITHGAAACSSTTVTFSGTPAITSSAAFQCVLLGIKNLDSCLFKGLLKAAPSFTISAVRRLKIKLNFGFDFF